MGVLSREFLVTGKHGLLLRRLCRVPVEGHPNIRCQDTVPGYLFSVPPADRLSCFFLNFSFTE